MRAVAVYLLLFNSLVSSQPGTWVNWSGQQTGTYLTYNVPETEADIIDVLRLAVQNNQTISVVGHGHSFGRVVPIDVPSNGHMIDLANFNSLIRVNENSVTVGAGMTVSQLVNTLTSLGRSLPNNGGPQVNTIAGTTSTNTHGTGETTGLAGFIEGVRLISSTGTIFEVDSQNLNLLRACKTGAGVMGVFTQMTVTTVPLFQLRETFETIPLYDFLQQIPTLHETYDRWRYYWTGLAPGLLTAYDFTDSPPNRNECVQNRNESCVDYGHTFYGEEKWKSANQQDAPLHNIEAFLKVEDEVEFITEMVVILEELQPLFPQLTQGPTFGVRFVGEDDILISPMNGVKAVSLDLAWASPSDEVRNIIGDVFTQHCRRFGARLHWGKEIYYSPEEVRASYPDFELFQQQRRLIDPNNLFLNNEFLRSMFVY